MGWGIQRDHKKSGIRGGFGKAGTMSHRKIQVILEEKRTRTKIIGKYGFKRPQKRQYTVPTMNVSHLDQSIDRLVEDGKAEKKRKTYSVNLNDIGIQKLLAQGSVTRKINVTVAAASSNAISKIEGAGGSVTITEDAESESEE